MQMSIARNTVNAENFVSHLLIKIGSVADTVNAIENQTNNNKNNDALRWSMVFFCELFAFFALFFKRAPEETHKTKSKYGLQCKLYIRSCLHFSARNINNDLDELQKRLHFTCILCYMSNFISLSAMQFVVHFMFYFIILFSFI